MPPPLFSIIWVALISAVLGHPTIRLPSSPRALTYTLPAPNDGAPLTSFNAQVATVALQGLVNRAAPRLFLDTPVFWTAPQSQQYFLRTYLPSLGFVFTNVSLGLCALLAAVPRGTVAGVALYDDAVLDSSRWLAVTAASLLSLLPVSRVMLADTASFPCLASLPLSVDYSKMNATLNVTTNVGAVQWGLAHLRPACDATRAYVAGHSFTDAHEHVDVGGDPAIAIGLDHAVAERMFVFNLSPDTGKYPAHAATWEAVVSSLVPEPGVVPTLFGWAEPEDAMTMSTSKAGGSVLCDGAPNLSFWAALSLDGGGGAATASLPYNAGHDPVDASACYVAFQSNEGDTPKIATGLQGGVWLDPRRGSVPIAWGVNPLLLREVPALIAFYASSASANDTWFSATAGAGYAYPWSMPDMGPYVRRTAVLMEQITAGGAWPPHSFAVDIWDDNNVTLLGAYQDLAGGVVGSFSMQPEALPAFNGVLPDGTTPLIIANKSLWYPQLNATDPLADLIARVGATCSSGRQQQKPFFTLVYGNLNDGALNLLDYAIAVRGSSALVGVRVVGMQDLTRLARAAAAAEKSVRDAVCRADYE